MNFGATCPLRSSAAIAGNQDLTFRTLEAPCFAALADVEWETR